MEYPWGLLLGVVLFNTSINYFECQLKACLVSLQRHKVDSLGDGIRLQNDLDKFEQWTENNWIEVIKEK